MTFLSGTRTLGTGTLNGGVATLSTGGLTSGSDLITVVYSGDTNDVGSTSPALTQVVNQPASTSIALASLSPSSVYTQPVTFTATVTASTGTTPTGTVTFSFIGKLLGACRSGREASLRSPTRTSSRLAHSVTASYGGDANDPPSGPATLSQSVAKAKTAVAIVSSANPASPTTASVTFTATVSPVAPAVGVPATGHVQFTVRRALGLR